MIITKFIVAVFATGCAIILLRPIALKFGLVDKPNERKHHIGSIPLIGGVAMFLGILIAAITTATDINSLKYLLLALLIIISCGLLDDFRELSVVSRFVFQAVAALIMAVVAGVSIESVGGIVGTGGALNAWSVPLTVFAAIGAMNALNMVDGIDGLAGGLSLVTFTSLAVLGYASTKTLSFQLAILFIAALLPFLVVNIGIGLSQKYKVFMGDSGSMFLGFAVAWLLADFSQGEHRTLAPVTALWLYAVPLIDTVSIMLRRVLHGRSPFKPDREHLHHFFMRAGYSDRAALLIIISIAVVIALTGIWLEAIGIPEWTMFILFLLIFGLYFFAVRHAWQVMKLIKREK